MTITHNVSLSGLFVGASLTITPTTLVGANGVLAFLMARRGGTITSVKWGGTDLVTDGSTAGAVVVVHTYYLALGSVGAGSGTSLVVTGSGNNWLWGAVTVLNGVDQATPLDVASVGNVDVFASITPVTDGAAILDVFGDHGNGGGATMNAQTNRLSIGADEIDIPGNDDMAAASRLITKSPAGAQTMDWTFAASLGPVTRAMAFRPATGGAPTVVSYPSRSVSVFGGR